MRLREPQGVYALMGAHGFNHSTGGRAVESLFEVSLGYTVSSSLGEREREKESLKKPVTQNWYPGAQRKGVTQNPKAREDL